ncbi:hypothetical protein DY000_02058804 [Brassica cretica]|uniref:Uncharacterized protein n=1 Tax=Brassica cretica TaxID=69181 RepID=A0ABQ7AQ67_BRACR|nr:hypothetical protein DY000_02058804 [Brassica cretica]
MILSQPEIRVLDVKCHISSAKEQNNFRVSESVRAEALRFNPPGSSPNLWSEGPPPIFSLKLRRPNCWKLSSRTKTKDSNCLDLETSLSKQTPAKSDQDTYKPRDREPQRDGMYRFSASSTTAPREHWIHREPRENPNLRSYKTQSKVWEERGSQRRFYQARERASKPEERPPRPPRDPKAYRNPTYQGRSYYREVIRKSDQNKDAGSTTSKRAVGEVREVMIQYTKSSDPTESAARKERMRQAEEQGEVEETALKIVRANLDAEAEKRRLEEHTTPERIPASQRLSSPSSHRSSRQKSDGQSQNSKSHDRLPASSRLGPMILEQSHNRAEHNYDRENST